MRTKSGSTYEVFGEGGRKFIACNCVTESTPVIRQLNNHWLQRLAENNTVVVTNRRGFAGSAGLAYLDEELTGLMEVVDQIGKPAHILGGCEAAVVPIALASRFPDYVERLIIVNGTACVNPDSSSQDRPVVHKTMEEYENGLRRFLSEKVPIPWTDLDTFFHLFRQFATSEGMEGLFNGIIRADVRPELAAIDAPTLVIHSSEDEFISFSVGEHLVNSIKGGSLYTLEGATHHIHPSYNDEVVKAITDFVGD